jgi:ABC-type branched-subunit amino acid transport system ATPase component
LSGQGKAAVKLALRVVGRGYIVESGRTVLTGPSARLLRSVEVRHIFLGVRTL